MPDTFPTDTIAGHLAAAIARLGAAGIDLPRREARLLLSHALGLDWAGLLRQGRAPIAAPALPALIARRAAREPLARIVGHAGFWTLDLAMHPAALVPRADSETLIEAAIAKAPGPVRRILDLGTGSGCLLLAALAEFPDAIGLGLDRSAEAAAAAAANAARNGLAGRALFAVGDWAAACHGPFDLILCNPPYIATAIIPTLMPEVARHDPMAALDGGPDGLDAYRAVLPDIARCLAPAGLAVLELGAGQAAAVLALARAAGLDRLALDRDLGGIERALTLRRAA